MEEVCSAEIEACLAEMRAFRRGGLPGLARLREVLPGMMRHYRVPRRLQRAVVAKAGLRPHVLTGGCLRRRVSFYLDEGEP